MTKTIGLADDGRLIKTPGGALYSGTAERTTVESFSELLDLARGLDENQALIHGDYFGPNTVDVVAANKLNGSGHIARTREFFNYPADVSVPFCVDYDGGAKLDPDEYLSLLINVFPEFKDAGFAFLDSSSGGLISPTGEQLSESTGMRFLFGVKDASDIPRFSKSLFDRCWLAGHCFTIITANGRVVPRTIFDAAVHTPENLDFLADPILEDGLTQQRRTFAREGHLLDTRKLLDLTDNEQVEVDRLQHEAQKAREPEANRIRSHWIRKNEQRLRNSGLGAGVAERHTVAILESKLLPQHTLQFDEGETASVLDVLTDPRRFDRRTLRDPVEPERGRNKAILYWNREQSEVRIHSLIHGGQDFICHFDFAALCSFYDALPDDDERVVNYVGLIGLSDVTPIEREQFLQRVRQRTNVPLTVLRQGLLNPAGVMTHHEMGEAYLERIGRPMYTDGSFWRASDEAPLWTRYADEKCIADIGGGFKQQRYCKKAPDYKGILLSAQSQAFVESFFGEAPIGVACGRRFYSLQGDELIDEPLSKNHRQRFSLDCELDDAPPERFLSFSQECFEGTDQAQLDRLQELFGVTITGIGHQFQKAFFLFGPGASGKSTMLSILCSFVPEEFIAATPPNLWGRAYESASIAGKRLIAVGEGESVTLGEAFKSYTGGDRQSARQPAGRVFTHRPSATVVINSNAFPHLSETSIAMMRRLEALLFPNSRLMSGKPLVRDLAEQLIAAEQGQILHWALGGARRVLRQNGYTTSTEHAQYIDTWKRKANPVVAFVDEYLEPADGAKVKRSDVYPYFQSWAIKEELDDIPLKSEVFGKLEELGIHPRKTCGEYYYIGWRIKEEYARISDDGEFVAPPIHEREVSAY